MIENRTPTPATPPPATAANELGGPPVNAFEAFARLYPNPILQITPAGDACFHNEAAARLLADSGLGRIEQLLPGNYHQVVKECLAEPGYRARLESVISKHTLIWWFFSNPDGRFVYCNAEDITQRVLLETQLRQAQKMESIGQLAGGVAHDFNNILTVIQGHAELLRLNEGLPPDLFESATQIQRAAQRAADLTRQLLMFSRKQVVYPRDLDPNEVITNMAKMLTRLLGENIQLELGLQPASRIVADEGMLEQVLMNLAVNARDAMPQGGQIRIQTEPVQITDPADAESRAGDFVLLSVADTGCGMSPEILHRIFEPFFTTKEVGRGTGLGLATVYGIIKQHQGWITVDSQVGVGSTFKIYLPSNKSADVRKRPVEATLRQGRGETVLLAEDEAAVATLAARILSRNGYEVIIATDGVEALKHWHSHQDKIALLFTDMVMPGGISGRELASRLVREKPALRVVYTTGYSGEMLGVESGLRAGENFLQKPYTSELLLKAIREMLCQGKN